MSDLTIEAPKPKRSYTRKPKVVDTIIDPVVESIIEPASEPVEKPKRKYTKKVKLPDEVVESPVEEIPSPPELVRQSNEPAEKKPRTEKQIAAFNKMKEARLKKQAELESLKEFAKEKERFDKEAAKVEKLEEKIVAKAQRKPRVKKPVEEYVAEPQPVIKQVSTYKPIMFV
jgi:hypothetical protein